MLQRYPTQVFSPAPPFYFFLPPPLFPLFCPSVSLLSLYSTPPCPSISVPLYPISVSVSYLCLCLCLPLQSSRFLSVMSLLDGHLFEACPSQQTHSSLRQRDSALLAWMSQCPQIQQSSSALVMDNSIWSCFLSGLLLDTPVRTCGWGP